MTVFWPGALLLVGGLVSIGSIIAMIGAETKKQEIISCVFAVIGLVVVAIVSVVAVLVC